jgi:TctA family transporter
LDNADVIGLAMGQVLDWRVLLVIVLSAAYGLAIGSIPGLTATMAVALLVPLTFYLDDVQAIAAIVTTVTGSIFAGDLPATLVRIPGTPASAAYSNDAYALTLKGKHVTALTTCLIFSVLGGLFGTALLSLAAPSLAQLATRFTSYEYFWLYILGLSCAVIVSSESRLRGFLALWIGLLLSTVGLGTDFSQPRLTFGIDELITGINFIPAMIGLFGLSEVIRNVQHLPRKQLGAATAPSATEDGSAFQRTLPMVWRRKWSLARSSLIGSLIGMLPGAGADIASWISYAVSKRFSRSPEQYGQGSLEGLADATGANNAALGGAWIPALVFGIPGDSVTAIALGVLMMKNVSPGPGIFDATQNPVQATLVVSIYLVFLLANLILLPLGWLAIRGGSLLIRIPRRILLPIIVMFCIVGSYSMSGSYLDVWVMLFMGVLGYVLERFGVPLGPIVLGLIMGGPLEHRFLQSITAAEGVSSFFNRPIALILMLLCVLLWALPLLLNKRVVRS